MNLIWRLGDGLTADFWNDHWIPSIHNLKDFGLIEFENEDMHQKVADYTTEDGQWDWYKLSQVLPMECVDLLKPLKAPRGGSGDDTVA